MAGGEAGAAAAGGGEFLDEAGAAVAAAFGETVLPAAMAVRSSSNCPSCWCWSCGGGEMYVLSTYTTL